MPTPVPLLLAVPFLSDAAPAVLADAALKSAALLLLAALVAPFLKKSSAAARHALWSGALTAALLLPLLSLALPAWRVPWLPSREPMVAAPNEVLARQDALGAVNMPVSDLARSFGPFRESAPAEFLDEGVAAPSGPLPPSNPQSALHSPPSTGLAPLLLSPASLLLLYFCGATLALLPLLAGWAHAARLTRRARPLDTPDWAALLADTSHALGVRLRVRLLACTESGRSAAPGATMPFTWGALRPVVIFPEAAATWPATRRRLVLLHELGHIRRHDWLTQTLAALACALHWFNPLAWLAARQMRLEREQACDDLVLASGQPPQDYARELLALAAASARGGFLHWTTVPMARPTTLEARLRAILDRRRNRATFPRAAAFALAALLAAVAIPLAMLRGAGAETNAALVSPIAAAQLTEPAKAPAVVPPLSATPPDMQASLAVVRRGLEQSAASLAGVVNSPHGGYVEKARADVSKALADVQEAQQFALALPIIADVPATPMAAFLENVRKQIGYTRKSSGPNQLQMLDALSGLKAAIDALHNTPGGTLGGLREKITGGIFLTAADIISGIEYANGNFTPSASVPSNDSYAADSAAVVTDPIPDLSAYFVPFSSSSTTIALPNSPLRFAAIPVNTIAAILSISRIRPSPYELTTQLNGQSVVFADLDVDTLGVGLPVGLCSFDILSGGLPTVSETDRLQYTVVVAAGGQPVAVAWATTNEVKPVTGFGTGAPLSKGIARALGELLALEKIGAGVYEPRWFGYGHVKIALWLKSVSGGPDYIYPVGLTDSGVKARTLYTVDEFVANFRPAMMQEKANGIIRYFSSASPGAPSAGLARPPPATGSLSVSLSPASAAPATASVSTSAFTPKFGQDGVTLTQYVFINIDANGRYSIGDESATLTLVELSPRLAALAARPESPWVFARINSYEARVVLRPHPQAPAQALADLRAELRKFGIIETQMGLVGALFEGIAASTIGTTAFGPGPATSTLKLNTSTSAGSGSVTIHSGASQIAAYAVDEGQLSHLAGLATEMFPLNQPTAARMLSTAPVLPVRVEPATDKAITTFLQVAGVDFAGTPGSNLHYDGAAIFVRQTSTHLGKIRRVLERYAIVKQVNVETKFLEVDEADLAEALQLLQPTPRGTAKFVNPVRALAERINVELLTSPSVTMLSDKAASISVSFDRAGQIISSPSGPAGKAGVELKLLAHVEEDNSAFSLNFQARVTQLVGATNPGGQVSVVRETTEKLSGRDGATFVVGPLPLKEVQTGGNPTDLAALTPDVRDKVSLMTKRRVILLVTVNFISP